MTFPGSMTVARGLVGAVLVATASLGIARAEPPPLAFSDLPGWAEDDHGAALRAFRASCASRQPRQPRHLCRAASRVPAGDASAARRFFETSFRPIEIDPRGFLTGYFEPEVGGTLTPDATHPTPLLARPAGLVVRADGPAPSGWPGALTAAFRTPGGYEAVPDREAIEAGALAASSRPIVYLDPVDAFMVHVQGSARVRLLDGRVIRVGFDGRNGHPYTAIGRVLAEQEGIAPAEMTADRLWAWLKAHPEAAPAILRANRSFIFFRAVEAPAGDGPVGAAGVALSPGRSLAVDRLAWPYGTPVWLEGELPRPGGAAEPFRRLAVAQDTGAAIVGPARGDLYFGSGDAAGAAASLVRHPVRWVVLRPTPPRRVLRPRIR